MLQVIKFAEKVGKCILWMSNIYAACVPWCVLYVSLTLCRCAAATCGYLCRSSLTWHPIGCIKSTSTWWGSARNSNTPKRLDRH